MREVKKIPSPEWCVGSVVNFPFANSKDRIVFIVEPKFPLDFLKDPLAVILDRHLCRDSGFVDLSQRLHVPQSARSRCS